MAKMKPTASLRLPLGKRTLLTPGRKPRHRRAEHLAVLGLTMKGKKDKFVYWVAAGLTKEEAAKAALSTPGVMAKNQHKDPEFRAEVEKAEIEGKKTRAEAKAEAKERLIDEHFLLGKQAVVNMSELQVSKIEKIRLATSQDTLDRIGVGVHRGGDVNVAGGLKVEHIIRIIREPLVELPSGKSN